MESRLTIGIYLLSDADQALIELHYTDGYTQAEIGKELHISQRHTGRLIRRATTRLRQILDTLNA